MKKNNSHDIIVHNDTLNINISPTNMFLGLRNKTYHLLRFSEKYTKVDMVYLTKGGLWMTMGNVVASASGFLLSVTFANLLPKEVYGQYKYIISMAGLFSIFTLQGMDSAITQAVAKGMDNTLMIGIKTKIKWGLFGAIISLFCSLYYFFNSNLDFTLAFLILAAFLPFMDSFSLYNAFLTGKKEFKQITVINIISQIVSILAMIVTIFLTKHLFFILISYFAPITLLRLYFIKKIIKQISKETNSDNKSIIYGKHLSLLSLLGTITKSIDQVIIYNFVNGAALAIYSIAVAPVKELQNIIRNIDALSFSKLAERNFGEIQKTLLIKISKLLALVIVIIVLYIFTIPYFYKIFFPQYTDSIKYSQFFSLNLLFYPFILINTALTAHMKQKELYVSNILSSIFYLIILVILTYNFGIMGVITACLLNSAFSTTLNIFLFKKIKTP